MQRFLLTLITAAVVSAVSARDAAAQDSFVNFLIGTTTTSSALDNDGPQPNVGIAFGSLVAMAGAEIEFVYFPQLYGTQIVSSSRAASVMGNIFVGPQIGPVRIYGAIGVGDLYVNLESPAADFANHYLTVTGGAGVAVFFGSHVGIRGDLRYYHPTGVIEADLDRVGLDAERLKFWRPTVGLTLKF